MSDAIKRWRAKQKIKQEAREREKQRIANLLAYFEEKFEPFKGKMFQIHSHDPFGFGTPRLLRNFEPTSGLGTDIYGLRENTHEDNLVAALNAATEIYQKERIKQVPEDEYVMATGNVIARRMRPEKDCKQHIIHAIEVITTKGVGYLRREILRGPLEHRPRGPSLVWDVPKNNSK
jgi:hypothetical protein